MVAFPFARLIAPTLTPLFGFTWQEKGAGQQMKGRSACWVAHVSFSSLITRGGGGFQSCYECGTWYSGKLLVKPMSISQVATQF
jgi:hypothetical protein